MRKTWIRFAPLLAALVVASMAPALVPALAPALAQDLTAQTQAPVQTQAAQVAAKVEGASAVTRDASAARPGPEGFDCAADSPPGFSCGPDVTIWDLRGISSFGPSACPPGYSGNCRGYGVGTDSCNIGTVPVDWCDEPSGCRTTTDAYHPIAPATVSDHSVIGQNLYRLKDGRFEQIGLSFLKHGFLSLNTPESTCQWNNQGTMSSSCIGPPAGGDQLGVGCTDFYSSSLNTSHPMGRRSQVNGASADHPENPAGGDTVPSYSQRIVVAEEDLDPALNPGALYWIEGQYVVRDDARSGRLPAPGSLLGEATSGAVHPYLGTNGLNNASHRAATVSAGFGISLTGPTIRELPAIFAWQAVDPEVEIVNADRPTFFKGDPVDGPHPPGSFHADHWILERFHAARRVTVSALGGPTPYHYEYAIHNINSDTAADGFVVDFPGAATFADVGFHDIDHHSGEPYDTSDWTIDVDGPNGRLTWSAVDDGDDTNALRWGTTFSFWFDSDRPPAQAAHSLDLFKIDELLAVPFGDPLLIFGDGFETGDTSGWGTAVP